LSYERQVRALKGSGLLKYVIAFKTVAERAGPVTSLKQGVNENERELELLAVADTLIIVC
jgi:hypothetical protein